MNTNLTQKQADFLKEWAANGMRVADAYRAVYKPKSANKYYASVEGNKLLKHPKLAPRAARIRDAIDRGLERAAEAYNVTRERNVAELARMAYANMADYTIEQGNQRYVALGGLSRDHLAAVRSIEVETVLRGAGEERIEVLKTKFTLHDKRAAIEDLNKMFGWVIDKKEVGRPGDFAGLSDAELEKKLMETLIERGLSEEAARVLVARQRVKGGMLAPQRGKPDA